MNQPVAVQGIYTFGELVRINLLLYRGSILLGSYYESACSCSGDL